MTLSGMQVAQVRHLAEQLQRGAQSLRDAVRAIDARVSHTTWSGQDADRFRHQWWPAHRAVVLNAADAIAGLGASASNNADAQDRASAATDAVGAASGLLRLVDATTGKLEGFGGAALWNILGIGAGTAALPGLLAPANARDALKTWTGYYGRLVREAPEPLRGVLGDLKPALRAADRNKFFDLRNSEVTTWLRKEGGVQDFLRDNQGRLGKVATGLGVIGAVGDGAHAVDSLRHGDDVMAGAYAVGAVGSVFGAGSLGDDAVGAVKDWRSGDHVGAVLDGVDAVADVAKASKNPLLFGAGVGVDAVTDAINIARGKESLKDWKPWSLL